MNPILGVFSPRHRLDLVAGICDGILTVLTLSAGRLMDRSAEPFTLGLACRVAIAGATSGAFIFFAGHYAQLRSQLVQAERQLNITRSGRLATTYLGHQIIMEALFGAAIGSISSFLGAFLPLILAVCFPSINWLALVGAIFSLMILGISLAWSVGGRALVWGSALVLAGILLAGIGYQLKLV